MTTPAMPEDRTEAVGVYKAILKRIVDNRPSGTRQRLAIALGKNRSFISQITNPTYDVPIPARHVETIFEVCHFTVEERRQFMAAFARAHPRRVTLVSAKGDVRLVTVKLPDLGDANRNRLVDELMADIAQRIARIVKE